MSLSCFARARAARADAAAVRPGAMRRPRASPGPAARDRPDPRVRGDAARVRGERVLRRRLRTTHREGFSRARSRSIRPRRFTGPSARRPRRTASRAVAADDVSFAVVADAASGVVGLSFQSGPVMVPARAVMSTVDAAGANADVAAYALNGYNAAGGRRGRDVRAVLRRGRRRGGRHDARVRRREVDRRSRAIPRRVYPAPRDWSPTRPRSRGARRSSRILAVVSPRPPHALQSLRASTPPRGSD